MRYFIKIAYNGKNYHGWQKQPDAITVQEVMERSLSTLLRTNIKLVGAGRTDTGVHAKQYFAHFDCEDKIDDEEFIFRMNSFLPKDIVVNDLIEVDLTAHARFDAVEREYEYCISFDKNPFLHELHYSVHLQPDVDAMNKAAQLLLNHKDFQCFSRSKTNVKTYNCDVRRSEWIRKGDQLIFTISANRFLRNMVRAIVGTLLDVGYSKISVREFQQILDSKDRTKAGASAPAHGLYLTKILYPEKVFKDRR